MGKEGSGRMWRRDGWKGDPENCITLSMHDWKSSTPNVISHTPIAKKVPEFHQINFRIHGSPYGRPSEKVPNSIRKVGQFRLNLLFPIDRCVAVPNRQNDPHLKFKSNVAIFFRANLRGKCFEVRFTVANSPKHLWDPFCERRKVRTYFPITRRHRHPEFPYTHYRFRSSILIFLPLSLSLLVICGKYLEKSSRVEMEYGKGNLSGSHIQGSLVPTEENKQKFSLAYDEKRRRKTQPEV